ncbi:hypothetical protein NW768_005198 [Fusarium equiseti]|uniref:C2H2-type domain-containing protein n=1 Tax=Fusarium equiseti TaxID=61235 RepID=A0ABQ8RER6_FUSEQ|nr:hypothetical protein NW768_005198 [Fusarium equiseti]
MHRKKYSANDDLSEFVHRPIPSQGLEGVGGSAMAYVQAQEQLPGLAHPSSILSFRGYHGDRRASQPQLGISSLSRGPASISADRDVAGLTPVRESDENFIRPEILNGSGPLLQNRWPPSAASEEDAPGDDVMAPDPEQRHDSGPDAMDDVQRTGTSEADLPSVDEDPSSQQPDVRMADADEAQRTPRAVTLSDRPNFDYSHANPEETYEILDKLPKHLIASYMKKHLPGMSDEDETPKSDIPSAKSQGYSHKCQDCDKTFPRLCELKKHQKRHSKPYGCTFVDCTKTFGSKNDWKRHESIQHYQLETWLCNCTKSNSNELCGKVCYRRESFRNHLTKEHEISDQSVLEEKLDTCRKGRHCDAHFWCGFCENTIQIKESENTWTKRCDHIDDHFSGRGDMPKRHISEWVHEKAHSAVSSTFQETTSESSPGSSIPDPKSPRAFVSLGNSGEDRRIPKDTYMWICVSRCTRLLSIVVC